jgi:hypothetical protein
VGTVCIGLASAERTWARRYRFGFDRRLANKRIFAASALDLLRRELVGGGRENGDNLFHSPAAGRAPDRSGDESTR